MITSNVIENNRLYFITLAFILATSICVSALGFPQISNASSHREAPLISGDPKADATDLYAFISPDATGTVTLIADYLPFEEPAGGPNFYSFDDNVLYEIKIDNTGGAKANISYQFRFKTTTLNPDSFLYNTGPITSLSDPHFNVRQTYTVTRVEYGKNGRATKSVLASDVPVPPTNVGPKSTPNYSMLQAAAIKTLPGGGKVFAGQSDDPFFADLGGLFDLLTIRILPGNGGGGVDGLKGYNVQSIAIQVPIKDVTMDGKFVTSATSTNAVVGVWTTSSRESMNVLRSESENGMMKENLSATITGLRNNLEQRIENRGYLSSTTNTLRGNVGEITENRGKLASKWVQVSRLGSPLVNEVVTPLGKKDLWNSSKPENDAQFANYVANPELGVLLHSIYGVAVPPQGQFGSTTQRDDLIAIFLTGIPGLTKPVSVTPAEELRLNLAIAPTLSPNRLGVLGGDNQGYPNGRRLADDVIDISIRAVAGAAYPLFHPTFTPDPLVTKLGDGVDANDAPFRTSFPYLALPWSGFDSKPH